MKPNRAYDDHRRHAQDRGIAWLFTYSSWLEMWLVSGKWEQRGRSSGEYCMGRKGDIGAYSPRNCFIISTEENQRQRWESVEKITDTLASSIRDRYRNTELTQREIALEFDVDQSYVSRIVNMKRKAA